MAEWADSWGDWGCAALNVSLALCVHCGFMESPLKKERAHHPSVVCFHHQPPCQATSQPNGFCLFSPSMPPKLRSHWTQTHRSFDVLPCWITSVIWIHQSKKFHQSLEVSSSTMLCISRPQWLLLCAATAKEQGRARCRLDDKGLGYFFCSFAVMRWHHISGGVWYDCSIVIQCSFILQTPKALCSLERPMQFIVERCWSIVNAPSVQGANTAPCTVHNMHKMLLRMHFERNTWNRIIWKQCTYRAGNTPLTPLQSSTMHTHSNPGAIQLISSLNWKETRACMQWKNMQTPHRNTPWPDLLAASAFSLLVLQHETIGRHIKAEKGLDRE